jgi:hypothetical protein
MYEIDHGGEKQMTYRGPERRKNVERRTGSDRREMIRFEPDKEDRRSGKDRRKATQWTTIASRS